MVISSKRAMRYLSLYILYYIPSWASIIMDIRRIKGARASEVARIIQARLRRNGYSSSANPVSSTGVNVSDIRLSQEYINKYGHNVSPFSGRRGRYLGWDNWVQVNAIINKALDEAHISANVKSLGGKFRIREGRKRFTRSDWEGLSGENVGSMVRPVAREDAWYPENPEKVRKKLEKVI